MAKSVEAGGPKKGKPMITKRLSGEVIIAPAAGVAKELLKNAITRVLSKKAAEGQSAKVLIKKVLDTKEAQQVVAKEKDVVKEIYNFYKKNPKYDTTVKVTQGTPVKKSDVIAARMAAKNERVRAGISVKNVAKPKPKTEPKLTEREKLDILKAQKIRKDEPIEVRQPPANPEKPARNELSALGELSKRERAMYTEVEKRIGTASKEIAKAAKMKKGKIK